jgi:uncharacterized protein YcaQ
MAAKSTFPAPQLTLTRLQARRFLLAHQFLLPPRSLSGKAGAVEILRRLGCIQFDPVNVVGWNPDLVLQARLGDYRARILDELLYTDRLFWDGFDKVQSIYLTDDWPNFTRRRGRVGEYPRFTGEEPRRLMPLVLDRIKSSGPISSVDLEEQTQIQGFWGFPIRAERAALEDLYQTGRIGIHHRVGTRRYFDLIENLLPAELINMPDPHPGTAEYHDWHVLRRIGSMGLAYPRMTEPWLGILDFKAPQRDAALLRLLQSGMIIQAAVEDTPGMTFMLRASDLPLLDSVNAMTLPAPAVTFLAPLDNLVWQREVLRRLFDFDYTWEVYTPAVKRKYGHYVLPVLYGDQFIARAELLYDRKPNTLVLRGWWWEDAVAPDDALESALSDTLTHFAQYLEAGKLVLRDQAAGMPIFQRIAAEVNARSGAGPERSAR